MRRDGHTCRYCGAKAPDAKLTVDHVVPVALGGTDEPSNLVTACDACNGGKTSSSPDAPLVAKVADDALRWAQAMRQAQTRALADLKARGAGRHQFAEWWDGWTYEHDGERRSLPRPSDWEQTVDQLVSAGLPLPMLKDCIDRAMGQTKVKHGEKFRYMCGVAWRKLTEIQEHARTLTSGGGDGGAEDPGSGMTSGGAELARELLSECESDEIERLREEAREDRGADTEDEEYIAAAAIAWQEARLGLSWLAFSVGELLPLIPDDVILTALRKARHELYDEDGEDFSREAFAQRAVDAAVHEYQQRRDASYLAAMPDEERAEWIKYANVLFAAEGRELSGRIAVMYPAGCARNIKEQHGIYRGMCLARGQHIDRCPTKATHYLRFAEFDCCHDSDDAHEDHIFCDRHTELALAGELHRKDGPVTVIGSKPITKAEEAVPF